MTILDAVREAASNSPGNVAVEGPREQWSYARLLSSTEQWADRLLQSSGSPGGVVAIRTAGNVQTPAVVLGAWLAGHVPLLIDRLQHRSKTESVIAAARPVVIIDLDNDGALHCPVRPRRLPPEVGYLTFSSGSQGAPKGILGNERGLEEFLDWQRVRVGIERTDRVAALSSPSFDVVYRDLFLPLTAGATLVVPPPLVRAGGGVTAWLAGASVSAAHLVPSLSARWVASDPHQMPDLRWSMFAGEPLHAAQVRRWRAQAPTTRVLNLYGPAEATLASFHHEVADIQQEGPQPVGTALPGRRLIRLETLDKPTEFRVGIAYDQMGLGYLDGTAAHEPPRFVESDDGSNVFRTDDRGEVDAFGNLLLRGRLGSLVKRRGTLVDLARIEQVALDGQAVTEACAVQAKSDVSGRIVLFAATASDGQQALSRHLTRELGADAPDEVVTVTELPKLPSGKTDRRAMESHVDVGPHESGGREQRQY